jgi:DNA-binding NarL/FixJ family response regulator
MKTKIIIFEDNDFLREGISHLLMLRDEFEVVGSFSSGLLAQEKVRDLNPDLVLMDIEMPGGSGVEAVKAIRTLNQRCQIIMLTVFDDQGHVFEALQAGANGYLLKRHASDRLISAIEDVLSGGAPMSPSIARLVIENMRNARATQGYNLSDREKEILRSLALGNSFKMIAADLGISLETVRTHIKKIYEKLHVHSQVEAVSKAFQEKLV